MSDTVLKVSGITKRFGGVCALNGVGLTIKKGEIHCLVGGNGSGKSTLIKIISGFYRQDSGTIEIEGAFVPKLNTMDAIKRGIHVIYQDLSVFPNLTVEENIAIVLNKAEGKKFVNWKSMKSIASEALQKMGASLPMGVLLEELSLADKQIVAIARTVLSGSKLLIMDEPTTTLTRKEIDKLFEVVKNLQAQGVSILFVSHKLDEVFEIADRFTVLRNGQHVVTDVTANVDYEKMVYYMSARKLTSELFTPQLNENDVPLLKVENLSLENGFADISFEVMPGEILGITGLLGSGRTELAKALFGLYKTNAGKVFIKNRQAKIENPPSAIKNRVAYVPEDRLTEGLFLYQSIRDNLSIANIENMRTKYKTLDKNGILSMAEEWKDTLSIVLGDLSDPIHTLSGGNQQKVVLAKWLATLPDVLILNGPTVGVDIGAKHDLHAFIRALVAQRETAVVLISDDIPELLENCNRILILKHGRITDEVSNTKMSESELINLITAGRSDAEVAQ